MHNDNHRCIDISTHSDDSNSEAMEVVAMMVTAVLTVVIVSVAMVTVAVRSLVCDAANINTFMEVVVVDI